MLIGDNQTKICGTAKIDCFKSAEKRLSSDESEIKSFRNKCNCLTACTSIEYESDFEQWNIDMENGFKVMLSYDSNYKYMP